MAFYTIEKRLTAAGVARYRCTVGVKEAGLYKHRENRTFPKQAMAKAWGAQRVAELESNGIPEQGEGITLGALIRRYLADKGIRKGRDKVDRMKRMEVSALALKRLDEITMTDYVEFGRSRREEISGSTLLADFSYLKTVLDAAEPFFSIKINTSEFEAARKYMAKMGITHPSNKRNQRIDRENFDAILDVLKKKQGHSRTRVHYADIFEFAIYSCMRVGEICSILWSDVDESTRSVIVRDRKDPRKKQGNHMVVPLLGRAWDILQEQPKIDERIFPCRSKTISKIFLDVKASLGIEGIRFHDTRREGASRLFEMGFSVEEVAQVTGHKNIQTLWTVYREMYPKTLHDRFAELQRRNNPE
ncbi:site-specific integrase [Kluyvera sp. CHPC 1.2972]|uniref:site-specific integrase n=1 Tax=Kluyvera sp. CHPC 1.2972 TaxID=2995176 RepID=UPI002FD84BB3